MKVIKFPNDNIRVHGIPWFYDEGESKGRLWRLPQELKAEAYDDLWDTAGEFEGIRLKFRSDTTMLKLKVNYPKGKIYATTSLSSQYGIALYVDGLFWNITHPCSDCRLDEYISSNPDWNNGFGIIESELFSGVQKQMREFELFLPNATAVDILEIGTDDNAVLLPPMYTYELPDPIYFYGGSIMHGTSAHPGMSYPAIIGRMLNVDVVNLGLSGCGKGEEYIAREIAGRDAACYVMGFGGNTKDPAIMEKVYYPFIKIIKEKKPDVPVVLLSETRRAEELWNAETKALLDGFHKVIKDSYEKGLAEGMKELYFIDVFFPADKAELTIDMVHLSDAGAYFVAEKISPVLKSILKIG